MKSIDDFELLKVLGKGAYAKVLLVKLISDQKLYAIKMIKLNKLKKSQKDIDRIINERQILIDIKHQNIIQMHSCFKNTRKACFVLDYCSGGELYNLLHKKKKFTESQALFYASQVLLAMQELHNNKILYRDLKPEVTFKVIKNILINEDGYIKITDFGLSKMNETCLSMSGTPEYLSPEILAKTEHSYESDIWNLGCFIFEIVFLINFQCTGYPPYSHDSQSKLFYNIQNKNVKYPKYFSQKLRQLLDGLFQKDPQNRFTLNQIFETGIHIKIQEWFQQVNFDSLKQKKVKPPFIPKIQTPDDTRNFDKDFTEEPIESFENNNSLIKSIDEFKDFEWKG